MIMKQFDYKGLVPGEKKKPISQKPTHHPPQPQNNSQDENTSDRKDLDSKHFMLRVHGETSFDIYQRCYSHINPKSTRDTSPKKANVICSNNFNEGVVQKVTAVCAESRALRSQSYLPVTSKFGWRLQPQLLKLPFPVFLILPVACITSTCCQQDGHRAQQEQGPERSSMDFSGTCNKKTRRF